MDQALKAKAEEYYDNFVGRLLTDYVQSNPRSEQAIKFAVKWLQKAGSRNILDIGCGIGWSSNEFANQLPGSKIKGLDLSSSLIETAKILFEGNDSPVFSIEDITSSGFKPDQKFDAIVMLDLYEHIPVSDRIQFHQSLQNHLKEEFVIVLTCPSVSFQNFLRLHNPELLQPVDEDVLPEDMKQFATQLGADLVIFQPISIWQENDYNHILLSKGKVLSEQPQAETLGLESRDSKIKRISKTKFKPVLKNLGTSTWAKARFPFLITLSKLLKSN